MRSHASRPGIAGTAMSTPNFLLLFTAMLVAAAGNTALQSVMPAIGREIAIGDFWVAIAYTWSAVLWVLLAPYWARKSDRHGRKRLILLGLGGFIVSMTLCGIVLAAGLKGLLTGAATFGLWTIIGPAMAPMFVLPFVGLPGPLFGFALIGIFVFAAIFLWLPDDTKGRQIGRGAAMSYPSIASPVTGASVIAAT